MTFAALGLGQLIMPLIAQTVVQNLDYRGSVAVMSAISLIGLFGGKKFKRRF
jgi:hypothetical protein